MLLDETDLKSGVDAISVVESPAIESNFVALNKEDRLELAEMNKEKRLLLGAALIPDKPILRVDDNDEEYYVYFSKDTVRKISEIFQKRKFQDRATEEHKTEIKGMTVVETWIVEDNQKDKSALYGLDVPVGTWMISMKADNDEIYAKAKSGQVKGFSIEGMFGNKADLSEVKSLKDEINEILTELI